MQDTLPRSLIGVSDQLTKRAVREPLETLIDRYSSQALASAGLVINAAGALFAKIGATAFYATVQGKLVTLAAGAAMPALTGVAIPAGNFANVCFFVDSAGTVTMAAGTPGATLGAATWPPFPRGKALVGFLIITSASPFVGGTTPLDTATTVYVSPVGAFDPTALV